MKTEKWKVKAAKEPLPLCLFAFMPRCLVAFMPASQQHDIYQSLN